MPLHHVTANEEEWDAFVLGHGGGFLQSWGWSQFQEACGRTAFRYRIDAEAGSGQETVSQFVAVRHDLPFGRQYVYVPRGPVVKRGSAGEVADRLAMFASTLREEAGRDRSIFARVEFPYTRAESPVDRGTLEKWGFRSVASVQPADTTIVDLRKSEDELLAAMHQKTRYNIKVAERHGVTVREADRGNAHLFQHDVDLFWRMLDETASRDKFHTHPREYYAKMLDVLSPKKKGGMHAKLVFAEHGGQAVAACLIGLFGDTVTYLHGASLAEHRKVMAPYLLHWRVMLEAKRRGAAKYDFWGIAPDDSPDHPWSGISRFKNGFGGERVGYLGAWELPGDRLWYNLYRWAKRFRNV